MGNSYPASLPNQGWENGAFWIFRGFVLDLGDGGFLFHLILSKIEVQTFAIIEISKARAPKGLLCDMPPLCKKVK